MKTLNGAKKKTSWFGNSGLEEEHKGRSSYVPQSRRQPPRLGVSDFPPSNKSLRTFVPLDPVENPLTTSGEVVGSLTKNRVCIFLPFWA